MIQFALRHCLQIQRNLYHIPMDAGRFQTYAALVRGDHGPPLFGLTLMNPARKPHVAATLDHLLKFDAEQIAQNILANDATTPEASDVRRFELSLVVVDDRGGGWTNRHFVEFENCFKITYSVKHNIAVTPFWTSETPTAAQVAREVTATLRRSRLLVKAGPPRTLRQVLEREARCYAGMDFASPDPDELAYNRQVIESFLNSEELPIIFACLYGDDAVEAIGMTPLGLSPRAGYQLLADLVAT